MILTLDVGNTNIVIGCFSEDGGESKFIERLRTQENATSLEIAVNLKALLELYNIKTEEISGSIISSVVPSVNAALSNAIKKLTGKEPLSVGSGLKTGLNILIGDPAQLGADLVCGAVAAIKDYSSPVIIFDLGTATTVSVVDKNSNFLGVMIMPGVNVSLAALTNNTSLTMTIDIEKPKKLIGTSTPESMKSGIIYGTAAQLDGIYDRIEEQLGYPCTAVATGGIAQKILPFCRRKINLDEGLVLNGLLYLYKKNI